MGIKMPETCWTAFKRQVINLRICCIWLVDPVESMMMHGLANPKNTKRNYEYKNIKELWGISEVPKTSRYIYVPFAPYKLQCVQPSGCISGLHCYAKHDRYGIPAPWTFQDSCVILIRIAADMSFFFAHLTSWQKKIREMKKKETRNGLRCKKS